jgi:hypothetical protein
MGHRQAGYVTGDRYQLRSGNWKNIGEREALLIDVYE